MAKHKTQETPSQETPSQETPSQETPSQVEPVEPVETPSQETPSQVDSMILAGVPVTVETPSFEIGDGSERTDSSGIVQRTSDDNFRAMATVLSGCVRWIELEYTPATKKALVHGIREGGSTIIRGFRLSGLDSIRCIACAGVHGSPNAGKNPLAPLAGWSRSNATYGKTHVLQVFFGDGSSRVVLISDTCFDKHFADFKPTIRENAKRMV